MNEDVAVEAVEEAGEDLMDMIMDQAVTNASEALRESGIKAQVVAEKTAQLYLLHVRSHKLSAEEHQQAEAIVQKVLIGTLKEHANNPSHSIH